ncbi:MAG: RNA polymerase sigma factor [Candidatus Gastranaerophilales bacterium]|nr:RNA polymerase sigma factor [Candidatus Gastranaerophilales bacterium]
MKDIIRANKYKVKQIIKNLTGHYDEDIEQEVYIKTYKSLDKYVEQNKFSQWICKITANLCKDYLKSSKFKLQKNCDYNEDALNNLKDKTNPEKEYTLYEQQKLTLKAINSLPKKLKETIILYEYEDYSYEQISKKLKVPEGTVKSRINTARKILKEKLSFLIGDTDE